MFFSTGIPDCVPEMIRSQREEEEREYERQERWNDYYNKNKEKVAKAMEDGFPLIPYGGHPECLDCKTKDEGTQTDAEDDLCYIICWNKECLCHAKYAQEEALRNSEITECCDQEENKPFEKTDYKALELLDDLTVENVKKWAMKNYSRGADCIIECMEDKDIQKMIAEEGKEGVIDAAYLWYMQRLDVEATIW